jgi:hypothetical protein
MLEFMYQKIRQLWQPENKGSAVLAQWLTHFTCNEKIPSSILGDGLTFLHVLNVQKVMVAPFIFEFPPHHCYPLFFYYWGCLHLTNK